MRKMTNLLLLFLSSLLFLQDTHGFCVARPRHFKVRKTVHPSALAPKSSPASSLSSSPAVNASVIALCKNSGYPDLCVSAVQPFLPEHGQVSANDMLIMHVNASRSRLDQAIDEASKALGDTTISPLARNCLETCKENYDDTSDDLDGALDAMAMSDFETLNVMLSAAMTDVGTCDEGFAESSGLTSPLTQYDQEMQHLISNGLYFATIL